MFSHSGYGDLLLDTHHLGVGVGAILASQRILEPPLSRIPLHVTYVLVKRCEEVYMEVKCV